MKVLKTVLYVFATFLMGVIIFVSPKVAGSVSVFYVGILSGYLGLDVWNMIQKTASLPVGKYKQLNQMRYILCAVSYIVLVICGYIKNSYAEVDLDQMYSVFLSAVFLIISIYIGGLEGNKLATIKGEEVKNV